MAQESAKNESVRHAQSTSLPLRSVKPHHKPPFRGLMLQVVLNPVPIASSVGRFEKKGNDALFDDPTSGSAPGPREYITTERAVDLGREEER